MTTGVGITFVYYQTTAHYEITRIRFPRWRRSAIGVRIRSVKENANQLVGI